MKLVDSKNIEFEEEHKIILCAEVFKEKMQSLLIGLSNG